MISFLTHSQIDRQQWNDCVSQSPQFLIYCLDWYLDVVAEEEWGGVIWEENGKYEAVLPVAYGKKYGVRYVYPPFFTQQLGVYSIEDLGPEVFQEMWEVLGKKFAYIEYAFNTANQGVLSGTWQEKSRTTFHLAISSEYDALRANYSTNRKRDLKRAHKEGLELVAQRDAAQVISFFQEHKGPELSDLQNEDYLRLERLTKEAVRKDACAVFCVMDASHQMVGGGIFLLSGTSVIFLLGTVSPAGREKRAMTFLLDGVIQRFQESYALFDFEGSDIESLAHFYGSFGGTAASYLWVKQNRLKPPFSWLKG